MSATAYILGRKRAAMANITATIDPAVLRNPSADSSFFDLTPAPFPGYPQPGAAPVPILSFTVPPGQAAVVRWLAVAAIGGGYVNGSNNALWQVLVNGAAVRGYSALACQVGTLEMPSDTQIVAYEGDTVEVTVQVPADEQPMPVGSTTAARLKGWFFPLSRGPK